MKKYIWPAALWLHGIILGWIITSGNRWYALGVALSMPSLLIAAVKQK
jgi:hypothetical protein